MCEMHYNVSLPLLQALKKVNISANLKSCFDIGVILMFVGNAGMIVLKNKESNALT